MEKNMNNKNAKNNQIIKNPQLINNQLRPKNFM